MQLDWTQVQQVQYVQLDWAHVRFMGGVLRFVDGAEHEIAELRFWYQVGVQAP